MTQIQRIAQSIPPLCNLSMPLLWLLSFYAALDGQQMT
jgi:hypothetical protein